MSKRPRKRLHRTASARRKSHVPAESSENRKNEVAELREALRAREDFLAIAAHELRNPITPIQLSVEAIRMSLQARDYDKVQQQTERLERLLRHFLQRTSVLLDVSRLTTGKVSLQLTEVNLSELAHSVVDGLRPILARSGSQLRTDIQGNLVCLLDAMAVHQIVENLLSNAIKYGEGKPIEFTVAADGPSAVITVRDHGIGISTDETERVFGRFERAVSRTGQPGFGIGLWVSRRLAESMDGSISATGEKGAGSLFEVKLPLRGT